MPEVASERTRLISLCERSSSPGAFAASCSSVVKGSEGRSARVELDRLDRFPVDAFQSLLPGDQRVDARHVFREDHSSPFSERISMHFS